MICFSLKDVSPLKLQISQVKRVCLTVSLMALKIYDSSNVKNFHRGVSKGAKLLLEITNKYLKIKNFSNTPILLIK